jgi:hypothetical protein
VEEQQKQWKVALAEVLAPELYIFLLMLIWLRSIEAMDINIWLLYV